MASSQPNRPHPLSMRRGKACHNVEKAESQLDLSVSPSSVNSAVDLGNIAFETFEELPFLRAIEVVHKTSQNPSAAISCENYSRTRSLLIQEDHDSIANVTFRSDQSDTTDEEEIFPDLDEDYLQSLPPAIKASLREIHREKMEKLDRKIQKENFRKSEEQIELAVSAPRHEQDRFFDLNDLLENPLPSSPRFMERSDPDHLHDTRFPSAWIENPLPVSRRNISTGLDSNSQDDSCSSRGSDGESYSEEGVAPMAFWNAEHRFSASPRSYFLEARHAKPSDLYDKPKNLDASPEKVKRQVVPSLRERLTRSFSRQRLQHSRNERFSEMAFRNKGTIDLLELSSADYSSRGLRLPESAKPTPEGTGGAISQLLAKGRDDSPHKSFKSGKGSGGMTHRGVVENYAR